MALKRGQIRDKIKEILDAAGLPYVLTIETNRVRPVLKHQLPAVLIYTNSEEVGNKDPRSELQELPNDTIINTIVEIVDNVGERVDAQSDEIAEAIEDALNGNLTLDGLCEENLYNGVNIDAVQEGSMPLVSTSMRYASRYSEITYVE